MSSVSRARMWFVFVTVVRIYRILSNIKMKLFLKNSTLLVQTENCQINTNGFVISEITTQQFTVLKIRFVRQQNDFPASDYYNKSNCEVIFSPELLKRLEHYKIVYRKSYKLGLNFRRTLRGCSSEEISVIWLATVAARNAVGSTAVETRKLLGMTTMDLVRVKC